MPSGTRRDLLRRVGAAAATLGVTAVAGCGANTDTDTGEGTLADERLYVHDDVETPAAGLPAPASTVDDATAVLLPAAERAEPVGVDALDRGATVCFVGRDAPLYLQRVCAADGRPYGVPSTSWTAQEVLGVVTPHSDRLDTHHVEHVDLPDGLPWGVGEALGWAPADGADPLVGRVRRSGRTDAGAYDVRERVSVADGRATVRTTATVESAEALPWERYDVSGARIALSFSDRPIAAGATLVGADAAVRDGRRAAGDGTTGSVTYEFVPTAAATRRRLSVGARTAVEIDEGTESLAYIGNARFRWQRRVSLGGGEWVAHTPGQRAWHGLDG